jgi:hypothetical protein
MFILAFPLIIFARSLNKQKCPNCCSLIDIKAKVCSHCSREIRIIKDYQEGTFHG